MFIDLHIFADVNHVQGKFASKEELVEALIEEIGEPSEITASEGGVYTVDDWSVEEDTSPVKPSKAQLIMKLSPAIFVLTGKKDRKTIETFLQVAEAAGVNIS